MFMRRGFTAIYLCLIAGMACESLAQESFPLGILGGRGEVTAGSPLLTVKSLIGNSPAEIAGLLPGDQILAIDGIEFQPHSNRVDDGGSGPQRALGERLDTVAGRAQKSERVIALKVQRGTGESAEILDIPCALPLRQGLLTSAGRNELISRAAAHLRETCQSAGFWNAPVGLTGDRVLTAWATVALKAVGEPQDVELMRRNVNWLMGPQQRCWLPEDLLEKGPDNLGNWALASGVVALVEVTEGKPDRFQKAAIAVSCEALCQRMTPQGRFGHDVVVGYSGKGFNVINTLSHLAWAMGTKAGVVIDQPVWDLSLQQIKQSIDPNGGVRYWTMANTGTADASLRTSSMALALGLVGSEQALLETLSEYLDQHRARTREAHAVGSLGMLLAPAAIWRHDREAYQRFMREWRWYLSLMQDHEGAVHYIGGKRNNGGDDYLGKDRIACVIAIMLLSPERENLMLFQK